MITEQRTATTARTMDEIHLERKLLKHVRDNVHGNIFLEPIFLKFVDTEQFQRLRDLKQLGLTHMVYPGAVHSRFEHSLGVYWLAGKAVDIIKRYQGPELGIEHSDVQTVKLAGLLHDIGHGPFSHTFERQFLPQLLDTPWSHEEMSVKMIDYIVDKHNIDMDPEILKKAKEMITASPDRPSQRVGYLGFFFSLSSSGERAGVGRLFYSVFFFIPNSLTIFILSFIFTNLFYVLYWAKEKQFLYDIVANGRNGIDVDKFDYIVRDTRACGLGCSFQTDRLMETMQVVGDEICYRAKDYLTIHKLFATRADLHRTVYTHAKVKAIELMVVDAMVKANPYLSLTSSILEPSEFWKLDDSILKTIETSSGKELKESRDIILRIRRRDIYQFCNEFSVPKDRLEHFKGITPQDIVCSQLTSDVTLKEDDVAVCNVKIDLTRGKENPLARIKFFRDYGDDQEKFPIPEDRISHLLPAFYEDMIVRVYSKRRELVGAVSAAFENYQLKTFGRKAQVHETPEKKRRI